jgi:hypothetical protein
MPTAEDRPASRIPALPHGTSRMRAYVQILGGLGLGLGLASAVGLNSGLLFAAYAIGPGLLLLCIGLLLPEDPETDHRGHP